MPHRQHSQCKRCKSKIQWNGQKWTSDEEPAGACLSGLGSDHVPMTDQDLPEGYRWATADETERYGFRPESVPGAIVVKRTMDSRGIPYTQDEADLAVPER